MYQEGGTAPPPHAAESGGGKMGNIVKILNENFISCTQKF